MIDNRIESKKSFFILLGVFLSNLTVAVESFGVTVSGKILQGEFAVDDNRRDWIITIFLFGLAASILLAPFIRNFSTCKNRYILSGALLVFFTGCCLFVDDFYLFMGLRFLIGLCGGQIIANSEALLYHICQEEHEKYLHGLGQHLYVFTLGISAFISGMISQYLEWRAIFAFDILFCLSGIIILYIFFDNIEKKESSPKFKEALAKLDWKTILLTFIFIAAFKIYISQVKQPWNTMGFYSNFSLCFLLLSAFSLWKVISSNLKEGPFYFKLHLLKKPPIALAVASGFFLRCCLYGPVIFFPTLFLDIYLYQYSVAGLMIGFFTLSIFLFGSLSFYLTFILKIEQKYIIFLGILILSLTCFLARYITIMSEPKFFLLLLMLFGLGISMMLHPEELLRDKVTKEVRLEVRKMLAILTQMTSIFISSILSTVTVIRYAYHFLIFSEQASGPQARFFYLSKHYEAFSKRLPIPGLYQGSLDGKVYLIEQLKNQATLAAYTDAVFLLGVFLLVSLLFFLFLFKYEAYQVREVKGEIEPLNPS